MSKMMIQYNFVKWRNNHKLSNKKLDISLKADKNQILFKTSYITAMLSLNDGDLVDMPCVQT